MSVRVGHIMRHEDVHGVSGVGKVAEVFEASNGKAVLVWVSSTPSVVVFDSVKAINVPHSHGGKTEIIWDWESPQDPDPMDKILNADKPELTEEEIDDIAEEAAEEVSKVAAAKVAVKIAEKVAEKKEETTAEPENQNGKAKKNGRKPALKKPATKKKDK